MNKIILNVTAFVIVTLLPHFVIAQSSSLSSPLKSEPSMYPHFAGYGLLLLMLIIFTGLLYYSAKGPDAENEAALPVRIKEALAFGKGESPVVIFTWNIVYYLTFTMLMIYIILFFLMI